jgi:hypothetical protein
VRRSNNPVKIHFFINIKLKKRKGFMQRIVLLAIVFFAIQHGFAQEQYYPVSDAMLRGGSYAEENYGAVEEMYVKAHPSNDDFSRKIILQFDVSSTSYSSIQSAVLKLYCTYLYDNFPVTVFATENGWNENSVTWSNAPSRGEEITNVSMKEDMVGTYVEFNISSLVINQFSQNKTFSIILEDKSLANAHARFYSRETAEFKPVLELEYGVPVTPDPPSGLKITSISATKIGLEWTDQSSNENGFRIYRKKNNGSYVEAGTTPANSNQFTDYGLEANTNYFYRVVSFNNTGESGKSEEVSATTTNYSGTDYYVDNQSGDDSNDGLSPQTAWKTLAKLNQFIFEPGDKILFKSDQVWEGELQPRGSGISGLPIVIDKYDTGELPQLKGPGTEYSNTLFLFNQEYWEIRNLKITNPEPGNSGEFYKRAIYVVAEDTGQINHLYFKNLEITEVAVPQFTDENSRYYGGIFLEVTGELKPTWFHDILFEGCYVHHLDRTGISNQSSWWKRGLYSRFGEQINEDGTTTTYDNWVPSTNIIVRNCRFERIGGNGLIMRVSKNTLVENNFFYYCGEDISGNAAFCFNTDSAVFQYNEASYTVYNEGDTDARGIDSDYRTKHTIIQYNYLHNNGFGGVVATGGPGGSTTVPRFNDSTVIRYNIIANNREHIVKGSGKLTNLSVYNNVIFSEESFENIEVVLFSQWSGAWPEKSNFLNDIFYVTGANPTIELGNSSQTFFSNNCYFGNNLHAQIYDPAKITGDPGFVNASMPADMGEAGFFKLQSTSACIDKGMAVPGAPETDFFGNKITSPPDIGIHEMNRTTSVFGIANNQGKPQVRVFPTTSPNLVNVELKGFSKGEVSVSVIDISGKVLYKTNKTIEQEGNNFVLQLESLNLSNGVYFLNVSQNNETRISKRIMKI